ncbi:hypothetical protein COU75_04710 [Candidatus Peregrinibacteria bacterium CG10_big_fil_rev_8_21_14_0_10_42_8]|nr:MAG: hypothetical protein COU75_04710 [Candidatus Peregrinibacteria bacterium CG10_big_fil_rev_8_21_14_0_10_42_8]
MRLRPISIDHKSNVLNDREKALRQQEFDDTTIKDLRIDYKKKLIKPYDLEVRIAELEKRGFKDPVKMITSSPAILGYAMENIDGKIADLEKRGFKDPVKMITSLPAILGYAMENIDGKIRLIEQVSAQFGNGTDAAPTIIERELGILSTKIDKLWTLVRVLCESNQQPSPKDIHALLFAKLEYVVLAHSKQSSEKSLEECLKTIKKLKKIGLTKGDARSEIAALLDEDPDSKTIQRYVRGYPLAQNEE